MEDAGRVLITEEPRAIEGVDIVGLGTSDTTGIPASGELRKGRDAGRLRPWAEDGDGDEEDNELEDIREILGAGNELLGGGKTSFLSGDLGGVVVSGSLPLTLLDAAVDCNIGVDSFSFSVEEPRERAGGVGLGRGVVSCMEDVAGKGTDAGLAVFV